MGLTDLDVGFVIDVFWYGVIQRGCSPCARIAIPSSLMLWLKVLPSDGIGILYNYIVFYSFPKGYNFNKVYNR
jgi:hypothetical protein